MCKVQWSNSSRESSVKRALLLLAILAFGVPAFASPIVYFDGASSNYPVSSALSRSGPLNHIRGQGLLTNGGSESLQGVAPPKTHGIDPRSSAGYLYTSTGLCGDFTLVLFNSRTDILPGTIDGVQITRGYLVQKLNISYAGDYGKEWKSTLGTGYVSAVKSRNGMTAREPGTFGLLGIGLVSIARLFRHKRLAAL